MMNDEIYLNWKLATEIFHFSKSTYRRRLDEIEGWIRKGRYPKDSIIHDSGPLVARTVLTDYVDNRKKLSDRMVSKHVKPYDPARYTQAVSNLTVEEYMRRRAKDVGE